MVIRWLLWYGIDGDGIHHSSRSRFVVDLALPRSTPSSALPVRLEICLVSSSVMIFFLTNLVTATDRPYPHHEDSPTQGPSEEGTAPVAMFDGAGVPFGLLGFQQRSHGSACTRRRKQAEGNFSSCNWLWTM